MRIDVSEEIKQIVSAPQTNYNSKASGSKAVSQSDSGAVFEIGVVDHYIENKEKCGSEALDSAESTENKQLQESLVSLAGSVTEEELSQIEEELENYEDEDIETIVTVQEKIRMQLSAYCEDFDSGLVEEFSEEEIAAIGNMEGNSAVWAKKLKEVGLPVTETNLENIKYALELMGMVPGLSDGAMEYFVNNTNKEITVESLYLATYSSMNKISSQEGNYYSMQFGGYLVQNTMGGNFDSMLPQIEKMLSEQGVSINDSTLANARWLFDKQLPINSETIKRMEELQQVELPMNQEQLLNRITDAIYEGKLPAEASLTGETLSEFANRATDLINSVADITDEQLKAAIVSVNGEVTLEDISNIAGNDDALRKSSVITDSDVRFVTAKRQLEEIRLQMTLQTVAVMEKNGIKVDVLGLSDLVEQLKSIENTYNSNMLQSFGVDSTEQNIQLYTEVVNAVEVVKNSPAALVGQVAFAEENVVLEKLEHDGADLTEKYKSAEASYETVMTKPRADMGDSIKKAFRNVDDILKDMDLEVNRFNQRAVRILGYNNIEITHENIEKVKAVDIQLNKMITNLTPSAVIKMIRENYNPLQASVTEINDKLQGYEDESFAREEKYSEFLWKLENKNGITETEREAYIGIYRLVNQIEKSDGAIVGALVAQGADITMKNLLSAVRTKKHAAMDYVVNDEFSGVESRSYSSISEQIEKGFSEDSSSYYKSLAKSVLDNISTAGLGSAAEEDIMSLSFEQFAEYMEQFSDADDFDKEYLKNQINVLREMGAAEENILSLLSDYDIKASLNNIAAAVEFMNNPAGWLKKLFNKSNTDNSEVFDDSSEMEMLSKSEKLLDSLTDRDTMQKSYEDFTENVREIINNNTIDENNTFIDVRTMKMVSYQLNIVTTMSKEEMYQIPVMIGSEMTAINLKFRHSNGENGKVFVSLETQMYGVMSGSFTINGNKVLGYMAVSSYSGVAYLQNSKSIFAKSLMETTRFEMESISIVQHENISSTDIFKDISNSDNKASSKELYQVAKVFIESIKTNIS